ncbi:MAG TPA: glycoside hydrolase family 2 TIM barrel-domain containing protein [Chloroflexia bacterium]|nr:glycoside hydrolase family 2 TIM barrel-domain containing protein [Chloroflexia bacterium]
MRLQQSLAGTWQFMVDPDGTADPLSLVLDRQISVPLPWQAAFPDLQQYSGYAWYRRSVTLDESWLAGEVLLQFGAVDYWCQVYVNGQLAGEHEGGYTPFSLPVRQYLHSGSNDITVKVYDSVQDGIFIPRWPDYPDDNGNNGPPFNAEDIPHGKQEWYVNAGGIWQDVTLVAVPPRWIEHVRVTTDIHTGTATVAIELASTPGRQEGEALRVSIRGQEKVSVELATDAQQDNYVATIQVANPHLWDTNDPYLYTLTVARIEGDSSMADEMSVRFGFREISTQDGRILLNGEPIYLLSALDQDMYADTIYTVPSEGFLRDEFRKAKELGINCLRCHIKPPDPIYLDLADEMGLLVWAEIPSWRTFYLRGSIHKNQLDLPETIQRRVERTLREMLRRDCNHPSVIIWTIVNEDWGTSLPLSASDREWVSGMYDLCKQLDPTRLVVDNSPCPHAWGPNIHVHSDLDDFHFYANIPDQAASWETTVEQFGLRPVWTFSSHGEAKRTGKEPIVLSEFGNWGLPNLSALRSAAGGKDPAWFALGPWWSTWDGEPGWPRGVDERFARLGLGAIWGNYDAFAEATQWHQYEALKFEIEAMRRQPGIAGYVITELADIYWESNGLLDFYRNPKAYHALFASINSPDVMVPTIHRYAYWDDEQATARLYISRYSPTEWSNARLRWSLEESDGEIDVTTPVRGTVQDLGRQGWKLPTVERARKVELQLSVRDEKDSELARNSVGLVVFPSADRRARLSEEVAVVAMSTDEQDGVSASGSPRSPLEESLRSLGYRTTDGLAQDVKVAVSDYPTAELLEWVREGGDLLFIAHGPSPFFWVQSRGGAYSGSWLTSYSWVRPDVHKRLYVENPLGLPFRDVMPGGTLLGLPVEDPAMQGDFLAGMVSGWVDHPAVHTVQFRYGKGRVIMTTFRLEAGLGKDPVATAMFHDLIDHLHSDACQPVLSANY